MLRDRVRTPRGRRHGTPRARRGAGLALGLPARRLPPLQPCPRQGGGRALPGAPRRWAPNANRNFFVFFQAQALFVVFFSLPFAFIAQNGSSGLGVLEWAGIAVWAIGNAGTILSDYQLAQWRKNPENKGKTARGGLWGWSRHPNYFFEWVNWCGIALVASATPWGWIAWLVPAGLLYLLFKVTGIPETEAQALRSREDYAEYQRTTSVFVPLPPRRA